MTCHFSSSRPFLRQRVRAVAIPTEFDEERQLYGALWRPASCWRRHTVFHQNDLDHHGQNVTTETIALRSRLSRQPREEGGGGRWAGGVQRQAKHKACGLIHDSSVRRTRCMDKISVLKPAADTLRCENESPLFFR